MRKYTQLLKLADESDPKQREALAKQYCRGWFAGSAEAKKALAKDLEKANPNVDWEGVDLKELNTLNWERIVQTELKRLKIKECQIATNPKGAEWKVQIAKRLRKETTAKNLWIAERLQMGHPELRQQSRSTRANLYVLRLTPSVALGACFGYRMNP
jgi:hypothetical protein